MARCHPDCSDQCPLDAAREIQLRLFPVPQLGPCTYGVPREHCHAGCGVQCRPPQPFEVRVTACPPVIGACCGGCDKPAGHPPCGTNPKGST